MLHTEASLGLGGQEIRILGEVRWLLDHGWGALIACRPESRLLAEARAAGAPVAAVAMRGPLDVAALLGVPFSFGLAFFFANQLEWVLADVHRIERWLAVAALALVAGWLAMLAFRRARRVAEGNRVD